MLPSGEVGPVKTLGETHYLYQVLAKEDSRIPPLADVRAQVIVAGRPGPAGRGGARGGPAGAFRVEERGGARGEREEGGDFHGSRPPGSPRSPKRSRESSRRRRISGKTSPSFPPRRRCPRRSITAAGGRDLAVAFLEERPAGEADWAGKKEAFLRGMREQEKNALVRGVPFRPAETVEGGNQAGSAQVADGHGRELPRRQGGALLLAALVFLLSAAAAWRDRGGNRRSSRKCPTATRCGSVVGGATATVRLIGIDAPERSHPTIGKEYYGDESAAHLSSLCLGKTVRMEKGAEEDDRYDRLLRYVFLSPPDGRLLNLEMIRAGMARAYTRFPFSRRDEFVAAEALARRDGKGLWKDGGAAEARWLDLRQGPQRGGVPLRGGRVRGLPQGVGPRRDGTREASRGRSIGS